MKIVVVSDNHYQTEVINQIIDVENDADYFFHCGDSMLPFKHPLMTKFIRVRGNNDENNYPETEFVSVGATKFMICHGHHFNVDFTIDSLAYNAHINGAQIALFGHTHTPFYEIDDQFGVICVNPGSTSYPRGGFEFGSYLVLKSESTNPQSWSFTFKNSQNFRTFSLHEHLRKHRHWWQV